MLFSHDDQETIDIMIEELGGDSSNVMIVTRGDGEDLKIVKKKEVIIITEDEDHTTDKKKKKKKK